MKKIILSILMLSALMVLGQQSSAQTLNPVIITWQANNFYPADFEGRALPSFGTPITVAAEVVQNNKILDVSQANFLWYVDENLIGRGTGLKEIVFNAKKAAGDYHFVRVAVQTTNGNSYTNSTRIYIQAPTVVLENNLPNLVVSAGNQVVLRATPYFFNISSLNDLNFSWLINGQSQNSGSDNQLLLTINNPQGANGNVLLLSVNAKNSNNPFESASSQINLNIQ